jgi:hypothetical protein
MSIKFHKYTPSLQRRDVRKEHRYIWHLPSNFQNDFVYSGYAQAEKLYFKSNKHPHIYVPIVYDLTTCPLRGDATNAFRKPFHTEN